MKVRGGSEGRERGGSEGKKVEGRNEVEREEKKKKSS